MPWDYILPQIFYVGQMIFAAVLGAFLGWQRVVRGKAAGGRTYALVSTGSCLFTIISINGFSGGDPTRIAAQVVVGIGFLGAGAIMQRQNSVLGLTTAAGLWISAAIGMAVGIGMYVLALISTIIIFSVFIINETSLLKIKEEEPTDTQQ